MTANVNVCGWTPRQDELLRKNLDMPDVLLAERVSAAGPARSSRSVGERRLLLGLRRNGSFGWSEERIDQAKKLHAEGCSASQIAKKLGGVSRCAVIGKLSRLGIAAKGAGRGKSPRTAQAHLNHPNRKPSPPTHAARQFQNGGGCVIAMVPKDAKPVRMKGPLPGSLNVPMWDDDFGGCRYATSGDDAPEHLFCCLPAEEGASYCAGHGGGASRPASAKGATSARELIRSLRRFVA